VAALSSSGKMLLFPLGEMKELSGGKGITTIGLNADEALLAITVISKGDALTTMGKGRGGKEQALTLDWKALESYVFKRARKGNLVPAKFLVTSLSRANSR
jgi:topoisomerase-4 subunit A